MECSVMFSISGVLTLQANNLSFKILFSAFAKNMYLQDGCKVLASRVQLHQKNTEE